MNQISGLEVPVVVRNSLKSVDYIDKSLYNLISIASMSIIRRDVII